MTSFRPVSAVLIAGAALVAASCSGGSEEAVITTLAPTTTAAPATSTTSTTVAPSTTEAETTTTSTEVPTVLRQPLTGAPVASEADIFDRPALAIKIDNHPAARKNHSGLAIADIVYEEKVEGSLSRFAAVFQSADADPVGPIRSGREQDVDLLSSLYEPLFGWSGGNPGVTALIRASFLVDVGPNQTGSYYRGPGSAPHNLYNSTAALYELTPEDSPGAPPLQFAYVDEGAVFAGDDVAKQVSFAVGSIDVVWDWNAETGRYERSQEGSKHVDKTYGQIGAQNVIVLSVDYQQSSIDANAPEAITLGSGVVHVFSNGEVTIGTWQRELAVDTFTLADADGNPIELTPGQTWVELAETGTAGESTDITFS